MKAFLTALTLLIGAPSLAMAANPLSAAEHQVCRSLRHCLEIVDTHPHDAFDYAVLVEEFRRFGGKGRDALIRTIAKDGDGAGHAADLIALMGETAALPPLQNLKARASTRTRLLVTRTVKAIQARHSNADAPAPPNPQRSQGLQSDPICKIGAPLPFSGRKREMPFFELNIAAPDAFGAYRPSAAFNAPILFLDRGWLRAAQPVPGGWLAAYPDGMVEYDNATGAPRIRHKGEIISLQSAEETGVSPKHWVFILNDKNQTYIAFVDRKMTRLKTALPAPLVELRRGDNSEIYASSGKNQSVTLLPDGSTRAGCAKDAP